MKLIFVIGLNYFCFSQVVLTSTSEINGRNIPSDIFESNQVRNVDGFVLKTMEKCKIKIQNNGFRITNKRLQVS